MNDPTLALSTIAQVSFVQSGYIVLQWSDTTATNEQLQALYERVLALMKMHRTPRLLSDHRLRPPMSMTLQQWLRNEWIPRAIVEAGYSHCAIVESSSPLGRLAARAIGMAVAPTLTARYFDTVEPAQAWILQSAGAVRNTF